MNVRAYCEKRVLLFDGAMGTYFARRTERAGAGCELSNLSAPEEILAIHREYIAAGCNAIKTNTFGANALAYGGDKALTERVIQAGWRLASEAAGDGCAVFADIGPIAGAADKAAAEAYVHAAETFLRLGAENFLFETQSSATGLAAAIDAIRAVKPEAFIAVSFAVQPDGYTMEGGYAGDLFRQVTAADAVGFNCMVGAGHMAALLPLLPRDERLWLMMPNGGTPSVVGRQVRYDSKPAYFAAQLAALAEKGLSLLGGCCGTEPAHMAAARDALGEGLRRERALVETPAGLAGKSSPPNVLAEKLRQGRRVIAVELDPPMDASLGKFMAGARQLQAAGVDAITIADCPIARARADAGILACKVKRELGLDVIPHMTCRDRNLNAIKALLLGLFGENVQNVLAVTGDPIPNAQRDEVKSVYQFNSRKLVAYIASLGRRELPAPFTVFGALNVNARNFFIQLDIAREKVKNGMAGFFTQPVLSKQALDNLILARRELPGSFILGGIFPIVSHRNALFMDAEVRGVSVCREIIDLYEGANRERGEEIALAVSTAIAGEIAPYVDGFYLMTPFSRTGLMTRLVAELRKL